MKENIKGKAIIGIVVLVVLLLGFIGVKVFYDYKNNANKDTEQKKETPIKYNTNEGVVQDKDIGGITFTNITCKYDGTYSVLEYTITNHTDQDINLGEYEIIVKDKQGNILANIAPTLDYNLKVEESYDTGNAIDIDLSDAYSIELVLSNQ